MSAKPKHNEEESGDDKVDLFIAKFQSEYSDAISTAREASLTTSTVAWQQNYKHNIDTHRSSIKSALDSIGRTCSVVEAADTYEEAEKDIKNSVKFLADERVRFGAWRTRAVQEFEHAASVCQEIIATATRRASEEERGNPLISIGLLLAVKARLDTWPRAEWNDETGVVSIIEAE